MRFFQRWILRRVLKSALVFEREATKLYDALWEEIGGSARGGIGHLVVEEKMHQKLLEDVAAGRLADRELEETLAGHHYHALGELEPLDSAWRAVLGEKLERALRDEEAAVGFYGNLERVSTIPAVKLAFRVLADMEREHAEILRKLLGRAAP